LVSNSFSRVHTAFIAQLEELRNNYETSGGSLTVIIGANKMAIDWLTKHISNMDKKIGEFAKQNKQKKKGQGFTAPPFFLIPNTP
jgi:hemerythrin